MLEDWRDPTAVYDIDPKLRKMIFMVLDEFGGPFIIHSGYRTPETNRLVGGASKSMHQRGKAVDFRIPGVSNRKIYNFLVSKKMGGVGYYKTHIHMDTGRFRTW